jgi:hypothetical protein
MSARRLMALCWLASAAFAWQSSTLPRNGDLGREWAAEEWNSTALVMKGKWLREGDSARFRVFYSDAKGRSGSWTVEILSIEGNDVRMRIFMPMDGKTRAYSATGRIQSDGRTIRGKSEWCGAAVSCGFKVVADWKPLPQGVAEVTKTQKAPQPTSVLREQIRANPGKLWRVTDLTTPGYHWEGTWIFENDSVRFAYKEKNSGAKTEGTLELQRFDGAYIRLFNRGADDTYEGWVQPDGKTLKGTTRNCGANPKCRWEAVIER